MDLPGNDDLLARGNPMSRELLARMLELTLSRTNGHYYGYRFSLVVSESGRIHCELYAPLALSRGRELATIVSTVFDRFSAAGTDLPAATDHGLEAGELIERSALFAQLTGQRFSIVSDCRRIGWDEKIFVSLADNKCWTPLSAVPEARWRGREGDTEFLYDQVILAHLAEVAEKAGVPLGPPELSSLDRSSSGEHASVLDEFVGERLTLD